MTRIQTKQTIERLVMLTIFVFLVSCQSGDKQIESEFNEVANLSDFQHTDFVTTLENPVGSGKNIIYSPSFLYAWDKVQQELKSNVLASDTNSMEFNLLRQSTSYQNSLTDKEYSVDVEIVDEAIVAKAFFNKTLPFETPLLSLEEPIIFNNTKVKAFGMSYFIEELAKVGQILYYYNDKSFILKLTPRDKMHEIILVKGLKGVSTLGEALKLTNEYIEEGKKEKLNPEYSWKYEISAIDKFAIPIIKFNIETNYKQIQGQTFHTSDNKKHYFDIAYQRTEFLLNENGAEVESEGYAVVDSVGSIPKYPKNLVFDNQFYIIIKRTDQQNPYFVMKVEDQELLTKI